MRRRAVDSFRISLSIIAHGSSNRKNDTFWGYILVSRSSAFRSSMWVHSFIFDVPAFLHSRFSRSRLLRSRFLRSRFLRFQIFVLPLFALQILIFVPFSALSFKDAFVVPLGKEEMVREVKSKLTGDSRSDHLMMANVMLKWEEKVEQGRSQYFCYNNFLSESILNMLNRST